MIALAMAAFTMTSCEDVPMPYEQPGTGGGTTVVIEPEGDGTAANPYNITALNDYAKTLEQGANSPSKIYFHGKVVSVKECSAEYGNATFYVSDDGTSKNQFYVYRCLGLGNKNVTSDDLVQPGMDVVVCGTITNYNGTLETAQKEAYIVSLNGEGSDAGDNTGGTVEAAGTGSEADPFNVAGIIKFTSALASGAESAQDVYFTGIVDSFKAGEEPGNSYGNATFYIKDEGGSDKFYCFRVMGPNNQKFTSPDQLKVGDKVLVYGKVTNYMGNTPETVTGKAYVVSVNGNGGSTTPDNPSAGDATEITCAKAVEICNALEDKAETTELYTITGYITDTDGKISRDQQVFWMADTKDGGKVFEAYWANIPDPTKALPVGTKVKMTGKLMRYGTTPEMKNGNVVVLEMGQGSEGGNDNPGGGNTGSSEGLSISGTTVTLTAPGVAAGTTTTTLDFSTLGYENAADVTSVKFPDGATLTFDKNTNKNAPKYYTATNGVRVYSDNILTFTGASNIAVITMECDAYNGVDYVGSKVATISFSGKTAVYTNVNDGANTQLRVKKITITYAK